MMYRYVIAIFQENQELFTASFTIDNFPYEMKEIRNMACNRALMTEDSLQEIHVLESEKPIYYSDGE